MSKRREAYLATSTMRATAHSLSLASSVLGFEVVELWSDDVHGRLRCTYVHCDEVVLKKHPQFNVGHYPNHKTDHHLSPMLCELAKKSVNKYHWRIIGEELVEESDEGTTEGTQSSNHSYLSDELNSVYQMYQLPFKTEMAYLVEGVTGTTNVYIVGLSMDKKDFKKQKLNFLQGVAFAIYVAAFDLDEETDELGEKESTHELDLKEHLPSKPLISASSALLSQANLASLPPVTPTTEGKNLGVWSRRHNSISEGSVRSADKADKQSPRNLGREFTSAGGDHPSEQSLASLNSGESRQSGSRDKRINSSGGSNNNLEDSTLSTSSATPHNAAAAATAAALVRATPEKAPSAEAEGLFYDEPKHQQAVHQTPQSVPAAASSDSLMGLPLVEEEEVLDPAPTWDPTDDFNFPVSQIPVHSEINCHMRFSDFTNVVHFADGSNANVYSAYLNGQRVVIKMLKESELDNETAVREFDIEHGMLARMSHPNMIRILGAGSDPRHFMVLEYLEGGTLRSILQDSQDRRDKDYFRLFRKPTFTYARLLQRAKELAEVFNYMHCHVHPGATVLHRDLKPDNVGFTEDGTLKLLDFGLVTCIRSRDSNTDAYEMTGCTGSLRYMAPEVALKLPYTEKVDVYSYGLLLWQMARDKVPFAGLTKDDFMTKVAIDGLRPKLDKKWPQGFSSLLTRCWAPKPQDRPSFSLVIEELNRLTNDESTGRMWGVKRSNTSQYDLLAGFTSGGLASGSGSNAGGSVEWGSNGKKRESQPAGAPANNGNNNHNSSGIGFGSDSVGKAVSRENSKAISRENSKAESSMTSPKSPSRNTWF